MIQGPVRSGEMTNPPPISGSGPDVKKSIDDNAIIKLILRGEKEHFRILVEHYQPMIFKTCMGFLHSKEDADDLCQDVFIQIYQSLSKFESRSSFSTWIYRIAVNASLNKVRKSSGNYILQRLDTLPGSERNKELSIPLSVTENPENILIRQENTEMVKRALDTLPENQRTALVLSKYDDLPQKEIAEIMKISEGAVESLLHRARKNLYKKLAPGFMK